MTPNQLPRHRLWLLALVWLAACTPLIPATTPPQLEHTPGAFVTLDEDVFDGGVFTVTYPDGWRIVKTSVASAPLEVVFAAPDNTMTIRISTAVIEAESTPEPALYERREHVVLSANLTVTVTGQAPSAVQGRFDVLFDNFVASLTATG
jgi:hypothetical protein